MHDYWLPAVVARITSISRYALLDAILRKITARNPSSGSMITQTVRCQKLSVLRTTLIHAGTTREGDPMRAVCEEARKDFASMAVTTGLSNRLIRVRITAGTKSLSLYITGNWSIASDFPAIARRIANIYKTGCVARTNAASWFARLSLM